MIGRGFVGAPFMIDQIKQNVQQEKLIGNKRNQSNRR